MNKWMKRFILSLFLMAMCICPVSAYVEIVEQDDSYFVTDDAKVLDSATEDYLVSKNQVLNGTSGAAIVVVTVRLLNADIADYAYTIFNEWQLGDETLNNGILLLISSGDEDYYCMVGRGLETSLGADEIGDILYEYLEPDFARGDIQTGVRKVFDALYQRCVYLYNVQENTTHSTSSNEFFGSLSSFFTMLEIVFSMFIVVTILVVVFSVLVRRRTVRRRVVPSIVITPPIYHHPPTVHHRPSSHYIPNRPMSHTSHRPCGMSSRPFSSMSSSFRPSSSSRPSSSFRPRSGGSTRGAGAGRRR